MTSIGQTPAEGRTSDPSAQPTGRRIRVVRDAGRPTIAQDEATSVVWGMPREAIEMHAAVEVLPLEAMAGRVLALAASMDVTRAPAPG